MSTKRISFEVIGCFAGILLAMGAANGQSPTAMPPMQFIGPQSTAVDLRAYARVIRVSAKEAQRTVGSALASVHNASAENRCAILVAEGSYNESNIVMKQYVDLFGGFSASDWKERDIYRHATI